MREPREDYRAKIERLGLTFHTLEGKSYWNESAAYVFTLAEIEELERATEELHLRCLDAVEHVISKNQLGRLGIPPQAHDAIAKAWEDDPPAIYGRFDLSYAEGGPPKMLEYNADTPTSLLEAAVIQWHWLQDVLPQADQFNSIWEGLVEKWQALKDEGFFPRGCVHFACLAEPEDLMTTAVLMDTANEVGLEVRLLDMREIGWDAFQKCFVGKESERIKTLFKLYPWEWMLDEEFAPHALSTYGSMHWIEPIWKMVLSNKAILAVLWELFPDHPNLLPAYFDGPRDLGAYVRKPFLGREGANVSIVSPVATLEREGPYDTERSVFQAYAPLPTFDGNHAVIGSWVIDGTPRGIGIRESDGPITEDTARFVPHYINPA